MSRKLMIYGCMLMFVVSEAMAQTRFNPAPQGASPVRQPVRNLPVRQASAHQPGQPLPPQQPPMQPRPMVPQQRLGPTMEEMQMRILPKLELKQIQVVDAARLIAEASGLNVVASEQAATKEVTLYVQNMRAIDAIETVSRVAGLWYRVDEETETIRILTTEEYQEDLIIDRQDVTRVFTLLHPNASSVAIAIQDLYGPRVQLSLRPIDDDLLLTSGAGGIGGGFGGGGFGGGVGGFGGGAGGLGSAAFNGQQFGGVNSFGGGVNGNFGSGGFLSGGGRFSRSGFGGGFGNSFGGGFGGTGYGGFGRGGFGGAFDYRDIYFGDEPLTAGQIIELERMRQQAADSAISEEELQKITQREAPIYVTLNRQHNLVIVRTADTQAMKSIERLVREIDRPTPQVLLEMKILQVTLDDNFTSVFDLQYTGGPQGPSAAEQLTRNPFLPDAATAAETVLGLGNFPVQSGTFVYQFLNDNIRLRIQALEGANRVDTVATPVLLASNNRPARIFVGQERVLTRSVESNVVTGSVGTTTTVVSPVTEIRDIGTTLFLIPKINADRTVTLVISQDNSSVAPDSATIPVAGENGAITAFPVDTINTANVFGTVVAKDGYTVAVGGLIEESTTRTRQKVPLLGDIPVVGRLFRREFDQDLKTELVLLITPHVVTTPLEGEMTTRQRLDDLSSSLYVRTPPGPPAFPPGPVFPWAPRRLVEGYQGDLGEDTGMYPYMVNGMGAEVIPPGNAGSYPPGYPTGDTLPPHHGNPSPVPTPPSALPQNGGLQNGGPPSPAPQSSGGWTVPRPPVAPASYQNQPNTRAVPANWNTAGPR